MNLSVISQIHTAWQQSSAAAGAEAAGGPKAEFSLKPDGAASGPGAAPAASTGTTSAVAAGTDGPLPPGPLAADNSSQALVNELWSGIAAARGDFRRIDAAFEAFATKAATAKLKDPTADMAGLIYLQRVVQNAGMKLELSTKIVEHGTSGVKSVLQTQA